MAVSGVGSWARGLVIVPTFDSSITGRGDASQVENGINYAIQQYEGLYNNAMTVDIEFQFGVTGLGESFHGSGTYSYSQVNNALQNLNSDPDQITSAANLPASDPNPGVQWKVVSSDAVALKLASGVTTGTVLFNQSATLAYDPFDRAVNNSFDFIGVAEHEISEILGRDGGGSNANLPFELMHYSSAGNLDFSNTKNDYFSIDGGVTNLKDFSNPAAINSKGNPVGGDSQDFLNSSTFSSNDYVPDSYNSFSDSDVQNALTNVDVTVMNVLGYNSTSNSLSWFGGNGDPLTGADWDATGQVGINPHHGANLTFGSSGETASHAFSSNENWELSNASDNGLSLTITSGTVKITSTGTNGNGQGIVINQDGVLTVNNHGTLSLAGELSIGDNSTTTNATASFSGSSFIDIGTVSGAEQLIDVGTNSTGAVSQYGSAEVKTPLLILGGLAGGTGTYSLSNSANLIVGSGGELVGDSGYGVLTQSGGTNTSTGGLFVANEAGSSGAYNLENSATLSVSGEEDIGDHSLGIFFQEGGMHTASGAVNVGSFTDGTGYYYLQNGAQLSVGGTLTIGFEGSGTFSQSGTSNSSASGLVVGNSATGTGTYTQTSGILTVTGSSEIVGNSGLGTFNQSGGTNEIQNGNLLDLGLNAGSEGIFYLSGNGTLTSGDEQIGGAGTGLFGQTGGLNSCNNLFINVNAGVEGIYTLSGGSLAAAGDEHDGYAGLGYFTQSGGTNSVTGILHVGETAGITGTYVLSGSGTLIAAGGELVGNGGSAVFNQSGGSNSVGVTGQFSVGGTSGETATYYLSGGQLNGPGFGFEYIGNSGAGTFNQSGGTHTTDGIDIGYNGSTGTYILSGSGAVSASNESVGVGGKGTFNQSGGSNTVGELNLAENAASKGTYNLTGGTLAAGNAYVGGDFILSGGVGFLNVSNNGLMNVTGTLAVYSAASNSVNLSGGTINTAALDVNGVPGNFNWTAGTLGLTNGVVLDGSADPTTTGAAFGAGLNLSPGMTLNVTGIETLGGTSAFSLTVGGFGSGNNPTNNVSNDVHIGNGSTLSMLPVNLSVPILSVQSTEFIGIGGTGSFVQEGGTNTAGTSGATGLVLGQNGNDLGIYSLSSPSFPFEDSFLTANGNEIIGSHGTGIFNQTG
jgi:hypothetical protein